MAPIFPVGWTQEEHETNQPGGSDRLVTKSLVLKDGWTKLEIGLITVNYLERQS